MVENRLGAKPKKRPEEYVDIPGELPLVRAIRHAMRDPGLSLYKIAEGSGVWAPVLSRFARGAGGLNLSVAAKLFEFFGVAVAMRKRTRPAT